MRTNTLQCQHFISRVFGLTLLITLSQYNRYFQDSQADKKKPLLFGWHEKLSRCRTALKFEQKRRLVLYPFPETSMSASAIWAKSAQNALVRRIYLHGNLDGI